MSDIEKATAFLREAAKYFEKRDTNGEDRAYWANVYNAKNCRDIADVLEAQAAELTRLREQCEAKDAEIARLKARLFPPDCPPADQERDHLAEQCATLGKENASFSTENERLRAKLDRAKEAFGPLIKAASRLAVAAQTTGGVAGRDEGLCAEIDRLAQPLGKARSVLSELSADAPAQPNDAPDDSQFGAGS
jgi:chromosome segregation ATPase